MDDIRVIALDVDGTLTDGKLFYSSTGEEIKTFNVKDGLAIAQAIKAGIEIILITGRSSDAVSKRAQELGISRVFQGIHSKVSVLNQISDELNIELKNFMFVGDDINDIDAMKACKYSACPKDAAKEVREYVNIVSQFNGGEGAVREIIVSVLEASGKWGNIVTNYASRGQ